MSKPLISIIIPVYNVEAYLHQCLDSIIAQKNVSWEAILVDDGSTDISPIICDEYAAMDNRIRVFHKQNGGVSSARNYGLDRAKGEWIAFVDSDDEITPDFLSIPNEYADCDVLQKGNKSRYDDGREENYPQTDNRVDGHDDVCRFFMQKRTMALWNKLIKREVIGDTRFATNIPIGEDGLFFFSLLHKVQNWGFSSCGQYIYYVRKGSAMDKYKIVERNEIRFNLCDEARKSAEKSNSIILYDNFIADQYIPTFWFRRKYFTKEHKRRYDDLLKEIRIINLKFITTKHLLRHIIIRLRSLFVQV